MRINLLSIPCPLTALGVCLLGLGASSAAQPTPQDSQPNILLIYADDLGYGDVGAYGAEDIPTPHIDALAEGGLKFTDAHSVASTCTPSRYSILTGEYAFRHENTGIATGNAALILPDDRPTVAAVLKKAGYITGAVGKWHLGMGDGNPDWNKRMSPGPAERGFDYSFLMAATADRVPTVYLENQEVVGLNDKDPLEASYGKRLTEDPTGREHPELLTMGLSMGHDGTIVNGISRIGTQAGGHTAWWKDESMSDEFFHRAQGFLEQAAQGDKPFFLYYAATEPHVPRVPNPRFRGATDLGPRGDVIVEFDNEIGVLMNKLEDLGLRKNTLVIVTSDNGPVLDDGYEDQAVARNGDHKPSGPWRGGKTSVFEGGTRMPFIVNWPGVVKGGQSSDELMSQMDLFPSLAKLAGAKLPEGAAPDAVEALEALLGKGPSPRHELISQDNGGTHFGFRQGPWKYISGKTEQLYNLEEDPGEQNNLAKDEPKRLQAMAKRLQELRKNSNSN